MILAAAPLTKMTARRWGLLGLLLLCLLLFFWQLDAYALFNETEAKQAEIARQIWRRQDWLTPYYNGEIYFDKPILLHWLIALCMPLVGLNEWAVRLPSAIAATMLVFATWGFVRRFAGDRVALLAATFLAANPFTFTLARTGQHDMLLTGFFSLALYSWFIGYATGQTWGYLGFFAAIALATLAKGPVAIVLSSLTLLGFIAGMGQWRQLRQMPWLRGSLILGAILLPWYGMMIGVHGGNFWAQFFGHSNVTRFLTPNLQQAAPWYFYIVLLAVGGFPWNSLLLGALLERLRWRYLRPQHWRQVPPGDQLVPFTVIWLLAVVIFMSAAATKLPWYVFPSVPGLAVLCAIAWESYIQRPRRSLSWQLGGIAVIYLITAAAGWSILEEYGGGLEVQAIAATGVPYFWLGVVILTAIWIGVSAYYRQATWSLGGGAIAFVLIALSTVNPFMPALDQVALAAEMQPIVAALQTAVREADSATLPVALKLKAPTLNFYSRIDVIKWVEFREEFWALRRARPERLLLITEQKTLKELALNFPEATLIAKTADYRLLALPPKAPPENPEPTTKNPEPKPSATP